MNMMKGKIGVVLVLLILFLPMIANAQVPEPYYINLNKYGTGSLKDLDNLINHFYWSRPYEEGVCDCSERSAYLEWYLENHGFEAYIAENTTRHHVWVLVRARYEGKDLPQPLEHPIEGLYAIETTKNPPTIWAACGEWMECSNLFADIHEAYQWSNTEFDWWTVVKHITPLDSDGDGVPDQYDYDPYNPNIQTKSDIETPGFEAVFVIAGLLAVTYLLRRRK